MMAKPPPTFPAPLAFTALWALAIVAGSWLMLRHEFAAAPSAAPREDLPPELAQLVRGERPLTLVVAVHPECPCTAASLEQLERLLAQNPGRIQTIALFWTDEGAFDEPVVRASRYWKRLAVLPDVVLVPDRHGSTAEKLGALVSGAVVAFDATGRLCYHGGMTASRGHAGSSRGMDLLQAIAQGKTPAGSAPAFGCALHEAGES